jgi:hypothetical protein
MRNLVNSRKLDKIALVKFMVALCTFISIKMFSENKLSSLREELGKISEEFEYIKRVKSSPSKYQFVKKHMFSGGGDCNFAKYVKDFCRKNEIQVVSFSEKPHCNRGNVKTKEVKFRLLSWLDPPVLELTEHIQNFSPGFAQIVSIVMRRIDVPNLVSPSIESSISCTVFCL